MKKFSRKMVRVSKLELNRTITEIMTKGNLDHLTTKKIRLICEKKYKVDLSSRRDDIDRIVMAFVKKKSGTESTDDDNSSEESDDEGEEGSSCSSDSGSESCTGSECSYSGSSEQGSISAEIKKIANIAPPKKLVPVKEVASTSQKRKGAAPAVSATPKKAPKRNAAAAAAKQVELDDADYARQLQAEEWNFRQRTVNKLFPSRPSVSNADKKKKGAALKKCFLSPMLASVLGANEMSRAEIVQKLWSIVRERNLFDPTNKQYAFCDEELHSVFGKQRIRLIGMIKYLKCHIQDIPRN